MRLMEAALRVQCACNVFELRKGASCARAVLEHTQIQFRKGGRFLERSLTRMHGAHNTMTHFRTHFCVPEVGTPGESFLWRTLGVTTVSICWIRSRHILALAHRL